MTAKMIAKTPRIAKAHQLPIRTRAITMLRAWLLARLLRSRIALISRRCRGARSVSALTAEPLGLFLVVLDFAGELVNRSGIDLLRLVDQLLARFVALDELVEPFLGHGVGAFAFICHRQLLRSGAPRS